VAVKKAAKKAVRKVNREGQRWTDDRPGMTLRLPIDLREAVTEESRVKGDLARIVLFALSHVEREKVEVTCRPARPAWSFPILSSSTSVLKLESSPRSGPKPKASSVNAIVVSVLDLKSSLSGSRRARR
jgi:hypothetical protein